MQLPKNDGNIEQAKISLAMRFRNIENATLDELKELANSGFADARLCAMARSDIEKAFLLIEKALRIGTPNEYAKQPLPDGAEKFKQRVDPTPELNTAEGRHIEWRDTDFSSGKS